MEIRKAQQEDIKQIVSILLQISEIHYKKREKIFKKKDKNQIEKNLIMTMNDQQMNVIVIFEKTVVYGVMIYKIKEVKNHINLNDSKVLWIDDLGIDEKHRRLGIGKMLIQEIYKIAETLKCERIELNCWEFNKSAIEFYEEQGMKTQRRIMEIDLKRGENKL